MGKYYFDLRNDVSPNDSTGLELSGLDAAMDHALFEAREMICVGAYEGRLDLRHRIEVRDEGGRVVGVVPFQDAVQVVFAGEHA